MLLKASVLLLISGDKEKQQKDLESPEMFQTPAWNIPQVAPVSCCVSNDLKQAAALGIKAN